MRRLPGGVKGLPLAHARDGRADSVLPTTVQKTLESEAFSIGSARFDVHALTFAREHPK